MQVKDHPQMMAFARMDLALRSCLLMAAFSSEVRLAAAVQELITKILEVLKESPPLKPSNAAVDLLLAVGHLQVCPRTWMHMQLLADL
jgi:hypothetical protein